MSSFHDFLYSRSSTTLSSTTMPRCPSPSMSHIDFVYGRHGLNFERRPSMNPPSPFVVELEDDDDEVVFVEEIFKPPPQQQPRPHISNGGNFESSSTNGASATSTTTISEQIVDCSRNLVTAPMQGNQGIAEKESIPQAVGTRERTSSATSPHPEVIEIAKIGGGNREEEQKVHENRRNANMQNEIIHNKSGINNLGPAGPGMEKTAPSQQDSSMPTGSVEPAPRVDSPPHAPAPNLLKRPARTRWDNPEVNKRGRSGSIPKEIAPPVGETTGVNMTDGSKSSNMEKSVHDQNQKSSQRNTENLFLKSQDRHKEINIDSHSRQNQERNNQNDQNKKSDLEKQTEKRKEEEHRNSRREMNRSTHSMERVNGHYGYHDKNRYNRRDYYSQRDWNRSSQSSYNNHQDHKSDKSKSRRRHSYHRNDRECRDSTLIYPPRFHSLDDNQPIKPTKQHGNNAQAAFNQSQSDRSVFNNNTPTNAINESPIASTTSYERGRRSEANKSTFDRANAAVSNYATSHKQHPQPPPKTTREVWNLMTTCDKCKKIWRTRKEAAAHLKVKHKLQLCYICFEPLTIFGCDHMQHFKEKHVVADDHEERAECPICGSMHGYYGMYGHMSKSHLCNYERERNNGKEEKNIKNEENKNRRPVEPDRHQSWRSGVFSPMYSNQSRRSLPSQQKGHFSKCNGTVPNGKVNEKKGSSSDDLPESSSKLANSVPSNDVEYNLTHSSRTVIKSFKIPKKKPET